MREAPFDVLRAGVEHLEAMTPLFDAYRQFYEQPSDPGAARDFLYERLNNDESVVFLAVDPDGTPLGFTQLYPLFSSVRLKPLWILNDLFVVPSARKRRVARALLQRARKHAVDTGARGLELQTGIDNHAAQALYEDTGWRREDEYYRYYINVDE